MPLKVVIGPMHAVAIVYATMNTIKAFVDQF